MADLIYVLILLAFTALCVAYIGWCDRIIGAGDIDAVGTPALGDAADLVDGTVTL